MKTKLAFSMFALAGLMLASCGKDIGKGISNTAAYGQMMKTWGSKCGGIGTDKVGVSSQTFFKFNGSDFTEQKEYYGVGDCKSEIVAIVKYTGTFDVQEDSAVAPSTKQIALHYTNVQKTALKQDLKGVVDAAPVRKLPVDEFQIVRVDGDALFFGDLGLRGSAPTADKRPTQLSKDSFGKSEHKVD